FESSPWSGMTYVYSPNSFSTRMVEISFVVMGGFKSIQSMFRDWGAVTWAKMALIGPKQKFDLRVLISKPFRTITLYSSSDPHQSVGLVLALPLCHRSLHQTLPQHFVARSVLASYIREPASVSSQSRSEVQGHGSGIGIGGLPHHRTCGSAS